MAFEDVIYIMAMFFVLLLVACVMLFIWNAVYPKIQPQVPAAVDAKLMKAVNNNMTLINNNYAMLFIMFCFVSVFMTVILMSNPVALILWLFINIISFVLYDYLSGFLTVFQATSLYSPVFADAFSFFQGGIPKLIPIFNMLMAIAIFGKRAFEGRNQP